MKRVCASATAVGARSSLIPPEQDDAVLYRRVSRRSGMLPAPSARSLGEKLTLPLSQDSKRKVSVPQGATCTAAGLNWLSKEPPLAW